MTTDADRPNRGHRRPINDRVASRRVPAEFFDDRLRAIHRRGQAMTLAERFYSDRLYRRRKVRETRASSK